ncbi:hypothetical protein RMATCC62417_14149 [Rhizopus microsporus]|nr:hypothetical protein RMATCC62417_14149 [Rhizopus microsporus]
MVPRSQAVETDKNPATPAYEYPLPKLESTTSIFYVWVYGVLLERSIVNRPYPLGLLANFWKYDTIRCPPDAKRLFDSVFKISQINCTCYEKYFIDNNTY